MIPHFHQPDRRQHVVGSVDDCVEGREFVFERLAHEPLRCELVALVWFHIAHHVEMLG